MQRRRYGSRYCTHVLSSSHLNSWVSRTGTLSLPGGQHKLGEDGIQLHVCMLRG